MNKSRFIFWIVAIMLLFCICILGDVISLGERIRNSSGALGIAFYSVIGAIFTVCIILPVVKVILTPEIKGQITLEPQKREELKNTVKDSAKISLVLTTVSQNGSIDMLANTAISFKLIGSLIRQAGYRPSFTQLFRLYSAVLSTSWIVASADELLDNLDFGSIVNNAGVGAVCKIFQPLANGAANAYTCLRIGYATIKYLEVGGKHYRLNKKEMRKIVAKEARKELVPVIKEEAKDIIIKAKPQET